MNKKSIFVLFVIISPISTFPFAEGLDGEFYTNQMWRTLTQAVHQRLTRLLETYN